MDISRETAERIHGALTRASQLLQAGNVGEANRICFETLELAPEHPDTNQLLGMIAFRVRDLFAAEKYFETSLRAFDEQAQVWLLLGQVRNEIRKSDAAREAFKKAAELDPSLADAEYWLGSAALARADKGTASTHLMKALDLRPGYGRAATLLAKTASDEDLAGVLAAARDALMESATPQREKVHFAYAYARGMERLGDKEGAFDAAEYAKRLQQASAPKWREIFSTMVDNSKTVFTPDLLKKAVPESAKILTPIFIVGVPRSGTSLVEQMLASHPEIAAADEVRFMEDAMKTLAQATPGKGYPDNLLTVPGEALEKASKDYQKKLETLAGGKAFVSDKLLPNFHVLGLIRLLFPWAKVLNVYRDPRDSAMSIHQNHLSETGAPYLASLYDAGVYYRKYRDLMDFWKGLMPDFVLDVEYEALVAEPEKNIRKILDFCGLKFDKACLDFHQTKRPVYTLSNVQVKQPLFTKSIGRAGDFETKLGAFLDGLEGKDPYPLVPPEETKRDLLRASQQVREGNLSKAEKICQGIVENDPRQPDAWKLLGIISELQNDFDKAAEAYRHSLDTHPPQPGLWVSLGIAQTLNREFDAARHSFLMAVCYQPRQYDAIYRLARIELGEGNEKEARKLLEKAINIEPKFVDPYELMLRLKDFEPDEAFMKRLQDIARDGGVTPFDTVHANYACANHFRTKDRDKFLEYVDRATDMQRGMAPQSIDKLGHVLEASRTVFSEKGLKTKAPESVKTLNPAFIVGIQRTGSTLLEQILAGHKDVYAAEEVHFVNSKMVAKAEEMTGMPYPEGIDKLSAKQLGEIGAAYQERMKVLSGDHSHSVDKMLTNGFFAGLIVKAMPWAKIIHMRRNALDMALSLYSNYFIESLPFTYDFKEMARHFRLMHNFMELWKKEIPDAILEVDYESLVDTPKKEVRRVLDFCGLTWDNSILDFHTSDRPVQTLSIGQVNQPMFKSSIGKWKDYAELLEPFRAEISDLIDEDGFLKG